MKCTPGAVHDDKTKRVSRSRHKWTGALLGGGSLLAGWLLLPVGLGIAAAVQAPDPFEKALANGQLAKEGFSRCYRYLHAWLAHAEPTTGLIPRNLTDSPYWNGKDSAADNYPFMVLSAWFTDRAAYDGPLRRMLDTERRLTTRPGWLRLTDDYSLKEPPGLRDAQPDAERIIFNSAEYVKDGLLALTEWLGPSPWSERMFELVDDSFAPAVVGTRFGQGADGGAQQGNGCRGERRLPPGPRAGLLAEWRPGEVPRMGQPVGGPLSPAREPVSPDA